MSMKPWLLMGILAIGCMPQPIVEPQKPNVQPVDNVYSQAADEYLAHYKAGLGKAASDVAASAQSGAYADLTALNEDWVSKTKEARIASQGILIEKMNALKDLEANDPKVAEMFNGLSVGWGKK